MTIAFVAVGCAILVGVAVMLWRWTAPGKCVRFGSFTLYYTQALTSDMAGRVMQHLKRERFADQAMDARLTREGETYQLQLICSGHPVESQMLACEVLAAGLSDDLFAGTAVEVHVCDAIFRPYCVIRHRGRFGRRITMNAAHLFYLDGVTDAEALTVATFLAGVGVFDDSPKIAQMSRGADGYEFRLAVEVDPLTPEMAAGAQQMARDLSLVLNGASVAVHYGAGLVGTLLRSVPAASEERCAAACHVPGGPYRSQAFNLAPKAGDDRDGS